MMGVDVPAGCLLPPGADAASAVCMILSLDLSCPEAAGRAPLTTLSPLRETREAGVRHTGVVFFQTGLRIFSRRQPSNLPSTHNPNSQGAPQ